MNIAVVGLSHKTATVEVREKLSIPEARVESAIAQLNSLPSIEECAILSTCNRLELYVVTRGTTESGIREITQFLSEFSQLPLQFLRRHLFILLRQDAVMHLLRVAAGLDSLVLGEGQILAQVKHTHRLAQQHGGSGRILNQLFKQALSAGKDVRTKTDIGTGAVSISSAAVELAQMKLQTLAHQRVAILGAGKMSRLLVKHLVSKGATKISIINRSIDRAQDLVNEFRTDGVDFQIHPFDHLHSCVGISDLVFTSTASTEVLLSRHHLESFMPNHPGLMLVDISVPRNIHADVNELPNVNAFNVDDLEAVVAGNQESRRQMALQAELLLEESFLDFDAWWRSLDTVPTINKLRQKMEVIREQELEKALSRLGSEFAEKHQDVIENLTRGIINKILHDPMVQLRAQQDIETRKRAMQTLQMLFDLDSGNKQAI